MGIVEVTEKSTQLTDAEIVDRVITGDRDAFRYLLERHSPLFYACAYNLCRNYDTAADIVQEALLCAYKALDRLEIPEHFAGWVMAIIRNKYRDLGRKKTLSTIPLESLEKKGLEPPDPDNRPPYHDEEYRILTKYMQSLPDIYREIMLLRYVEDLSYKEIAKTLHLPPTTVTNRLTYARRMLIKMAKEGGLL